MTCGPVVIRRLVSRHGTRQIEWRCPGCRRWHYLSRTQTFGLLAYGGAIYKWNESDFRPTIEQPMRHSGDGCFYTMRQGRLQFSDECTHDLAGKDVAMEPIDE